MTALKQSPSRNILFYLLIFFLMFYTFSTYQQLQQQESPSYGQIRLLFEQEKVNAFTVKDDVVALSVLQTDGTYAREDYKLADFDVFYDDMHDLIDQQWKEGIIEDYDYVPTFHPWWLDYLPTILTFVMLGAFFIVMMRRQAGGGVGGNPPNFSHAKTKTISDQDNPVTFADVAGVDEEKEELAEVVDFLRDPAKYTALGARIPKGILLVGPPGTGKTLIAKAVAGEAGVHFLSISGSDFVELYVGVGASRVRDLFAEAQKEAPSIIFIDEIDAVGRQRGTGLGGGHDEREQTLNQLLVEMDGFGTGAGVIVMAATNRADILDPAILRPGRFDRQIYVGLPDIRGREQILHVHAKKKPLGDDVSLPDIAKATAGFTGADLENLLNEAALLAARDNRPFLTQQNIHDAMLKVIAGPEKRSRVVVEQERRLTAYHEAGHAIVIHELETQDPVHQITIVPRGSAGGMTIHLPQEDKSYRSKKYLEEEIAVCLGGRVAEALVLGDISTGASSDIRRATSVARAMVTKYGMSDKLGAILYGDEQSEVFIGRSMAQSRGYSETIATQIDEEVQAIVRTAYIRCEQILTAQRDKLDTIADYLLTHESMDADTFAALFLPPQSQEDSTPEQA